MQDELSHYDVLGVSPAAPDEMIEASVWRLVDRAMGLTYTSPQRSDELWGRIRAIRSDLLSGEERRRAYNRGLLEARDALESGKRESNVVDLPSRHRDDSTPGSFRRRGGASGGDLASLRKSRAGRGHLRLVVRHSLDALVGILLMAGIALLLLHPWQGGSDKTLVALALSSSGAQQGTAYASGQIVNLRWSHVPTAVVYRLQVATAPVIENPAIPLSQPTVNALTQSDSYRLRVIGSQIYYWRVRVNVLGTWQPYSQARIFAVARPSVGTPSPRTPVNGSIHRPGRLTLCWSRVFGADGYVVKLKQSTKVVHHSCQTVTTKPGKYRWQVESLVRGVKVYTGSFSPPAQFVVRPPAGRLHHFSKRGSAAGSGAGSAGSAGSPPTGSAGTQTIISSSAVIPAVVFVRPTSARRTTRDSSVRHRALNSFTPPPPPAVHQKLRSAIKRSLPGYPPPPPPFP